MSRTIFPDLKLFKKTIREHFLVALREIFKIHPVYPYEENQEAETKIHIEPTYATRTYEGKNPQMLVKVGGYEFHLQDMLGNNLFSDQRNELGVVGGFTSLKNMSTAISVVVRAYAEEESSDLADELASLGVYSAKHMFAQVGIQIRRSSISETTKSGQDDHYDTVVVFEVDVPWEFSQASKKASEDGDVEYEADPIANGSYREPGVSVFNTKKF